MSLDLFTPSIEAADQDVTQSAAKFLPAGFGETWDVAWRSGTEFHNSAGYAMARERALTDYRDYVRDKTGEQLPHLGVAQGGELAMYGDDFKSLDDFNQAQAKISEKFPDLGLQPLSDADIDTMTRRRMAKAHDDAAAMQSRETTWGGTAGSVAGMLAGSFTDPVVLATLPLGGIGEAGIALRAGEFALISGGTEAAVAALSAGTREAAVPGSSKDIPGEIAGATIFGGILGAGFGALGKLFKLGEKPLPTSMREDVNALSSEAQLAATNPFPTAAGEVAARDAVKDATSALVRGDLVRAGENFDPVHVGDLAVAAKAATPEDLAIAGERHLRPETHADLPDVERFDPMPGPADDAASYWESRLETAGAAERKALGATDADLAPKYRLEPTEAATPLQRFYNIIDADGNEVGGLYTTVMGDIARVENIEVAAGANALGPSATRSLLKQYRELNPEIKELTGERISGARFGGQEVRDGEHVSVRLPDVPARDLTPDEMVRLAADPSVESAQLHNLDHVMAANPDADFTIATRLDDGSYRFDTRKLSDVMKELDEAELAGKEIEACAIGMMAAE